MYTQLSTWLAVSAALWPTVTAFYPYQYDSGSTTASSRRRSAKLPRPNSGSITLPLRRVPAPIRSRQQNTYSIVNSKDPSQENSIAIDQDGSDLSYMVALTIGDSKEEYHLLLDSAASNTWVMGQDCKTDACGTHTTFGTGDSSSLKTQNTPFSVTYGTGSVSGTLATDTLHIGSLSPSVSFGLATNVSDEFKSYPMDGILGIGRGDVVKGTAQVMDVLKADQQIGAKMYGIHLSRARDGLNDGELNLGDVNTARFAGDLNWLDCIPNDTGFWEIPVDDATVNGAPVGLSAKQGIMDTGTSYILMPPADALAIHSLIPGFAQAGEIFSVPCDTKAPLQFVFGKTGYNISTADWLGGSLESGLCRSNIVGRQTFNESQWLIGDVFLKNVYAVFDFDGSRVGLGMPPSESSTPGSSAGGSASSTAAATATATATASTAPGATQTSAMEGSVVPSTSAAADSQGQNSQQGSADALPQAPLALALCALAISLCI
ncbi:aspartic peptidase domain-containing protein [Boeremia exigua]|uniref:aspartic peptidase domain-containing protein n=1 Tax=Boeremia exigua TaxID=749465 RepID=UPI001E8EB69F|nr:aspartic peptidase domain-containing protein [Boeremia exigua]KAH6639451.1 aspartic peptidase domain-containing protein [Boeremia exigua]